MDLDTQPCMSKSLAVLGVQNTVRRLFRLVNIVGHCDIVGNTKH
jgi:hypothetical protein